MRPDLPEVEPLPPFVDPVVLRRFSAELLDPPRRMKVSDAAEAYRYLNNAGGGTVGPWRNAETPYMVEPGDMLTSRAHEAVVFVGPAQSGKTDHLIVNWLAWSVMVDPADFLVVQTGVNTARDFSIRRINRLNRDSVEIGRRLVGSRHGDNVFDKQYRGMMVSIGYPTIDQLSGRSIPRVGLTDYDRMTADVDGEGSAFHLARARTKTFGSRGMTLAESSPGRPILDRKWRAKTPHEAPPATGILALYNAGDRRRWYWPCPHCGEYFEGSFARLRWDDVEDIGEAAASVVMICPSHGCVIEPASKGEMNARGVWLAEDQAIDAAGVVSGSPRRSLTASYWLKGPAAAFGTWAGLVRKYLEALAEREVTGDEEALKTTVNTDQGEAFLPTAASHELPVAVEELLERVEDIPAGVVPASARVLIVSVDVQANRFEILWRAFGEQFESWLVAREVIFTAPHENRPIDPGAHVEDWEALDPLLDRGFPIEGLPGWSLRPARLAIDSGGASGVTPNAYAFYRRQRRAGNGRRVVLTKGASAPNAARVIETRPDNRRRRGRTSKARGDVPVWQFNTNALKDELDGQLRRAKPGPRYVHIPRALIGDAPPYALLEELTAEERDDKGRWQKVKARNEALDLMVMASVAGIAMALEKVDWSAPPDWAASFDKNFYATRPTEAAEITEGPAPTQPARQVAPHGVPHGSARPQYLKGRKGYLR